MALFPGKNPKQELHPVLRGLSERNLNALYCAGEFICLVKLDRLEVVSTENRYILVLEGCGSWTTDTGILEPGFAAPDVLTPGQLSRYERLNGWLVADSSVKILTLAEAAISTLEPEIQAHLYRNLFTISSNRLNQMQHRLASRVQQHQLYQDKLARALQHDRDQYSNSAAIKVLLQKVPALPPYASKLTTMLLGNQISAKEVAAVARMDPSLTASVLKTVNSAYFGLTHKIMDFHHAFVLLGFNQIYQIVVSKGIQSTMPKTPAFQQLQYHSVLISVLSQEISLTLKQGSAPLLSTLGLLHDIGKSVILLMKRQQPRHAFLINLLDPDIVGSMLLREWNIPNEICGCLEFLALSELAPPEDIPDEHRVNLTILNLAHSCCDFLLANTQGEFAAAFSQDQFRALNCRSLDAEDFLRNKLAPSIASRGSRLPKLVQNLIDRKIGSGKSSAGKSPALARSA